MGKIGRSVAGFCFIGACPVLFAGLAMLGCTGSVQGAGERGQGGAGTRASNGDTASAVAGMPTLPLQPTSNGPLWFRLTNEQVRNTLTDLFGDGITIGPLDPDLRFEGFATLGAGSVVTAAQGVERYTNLAFDVASQVMKQPEVRGRWVSCTPAGVEIGPCAKAMVRSLGRLLFRRPVDDTTVAALTQLAEAVAIETKDPWFALEQVLAAMLQSPRFLYMLDSVAPAPVEAKVARLDQYTIASRLAFTLTNAGPDAALLDAVQANELATAEGVQKQSDRLMQRPTFRRAFRSFFASMWDI